MSIKNDYKNIIGKKSIEALEYYIFGYYQGVKEIKDATFFERFLHRLQNKYHVYSYYNWKHIILWQSGLSDELAFNNFYDELDEFMNSDVPKLEITDGRNETIYKLLYFNRLRPILIVGSENKLYRLYHLIHGYESVSNNSDINGIHFSLQFQKWIENKYSVKTGQDWYRIINFYSEIEEEAIKNLYELLNEFLIETTGKNLEENARLE